jgi:hypothetical protein
MNLDYKAVVARPAAINRATPRAWLEHLYCRPSDGLNDQAVKKALIARQKAGKAANLTRELLQRSASTVEFRHARKIVGGPKSVSKGLPGGASDNVQIFRCPATWSDAQKEGATALLGLSQLEAAGDADLSRGLAMTHSRVLTVDEANGKGPCDREQLTQITKYSLGALFDHLKGGWLTVVVRNVSLVQHHVLSNNVLGTNETPQPLTPDDCEAMAADLRGILGSVASDHRLPTAWTNKVPYPYNQFEQKIGKLGDADFRAECHDASRPPITTYAELLRVMAENNVGKVSLDQDAVPQTDNGILKPLQDFDAKSLHAPQGATRVDIALPTDLKLHAQTNEHDATHHRRNPYPTHYFVEIPSVKGARPGAALLSGEGAVELKIDTCVFHERTALEDGVVFVNFGAGHFGVLMHIKIPGMD